MSKILSRVWMDTTDQDQEALRRKRSMRILQRARLRRALHVTVSLVLPALRSSVERGSDIILALIAILLLSPVMLIACLAILIEDRGPFLFRQQRVGLGGKPFHMLKFRSMRVDAPKLQAALDARNESTAGVLFKMRADPRITRTGRIIRKLSIDEMPQLFNVLLGDMAMVGPRPALPREVARYTQNERIRLSVRPGITCFWQVQGRSDIDFNGQVHLDLEYIRRRSMLINVSILLKTVPAVVSGKGAY